MPSDNKPHRIGPTPFGGPTDLGDVLPFYNAASSRASPMPTSTT